MLAASTIINYHIIPQVIGEIRNCEISGHVQNTETFVQRCSVKKVFLKVSLNSQVNICTRVSFLIKLQASDLVNCVKFLRTLFLLNSSGGCFWKHNVTMQRTAEFASNSTANIKLSEHLIFFLVISNKFFSKSKNVAAKKLCGGAVAQKVRRKLTCYSYFAML